MSTGMVNTSMTFLRPNLSAMAPASGHPSNAPSGMNAPIQASSSFDTVKEYCLFSIIGPAGAVHASVVPAMNPPIVAVRTDIHNIISITHILFRAVNTI